MRAVTPVLLKVKREVSCNDLATAVAHEPCRSELSHESVNNWHSSLSSLPLLNQVKITAPIHKAIRSNWSNTLLPEHLILMGFTVEAEEVAPTQLEIEVSCRIICNDLFLVLFYLMVYLANGEAAIG